MVTCKILLLPLVCLVTRVAVTGRRIVRLSDDIWPLHYDLTLKMDDSGNSFSGVVNITLQIRHETNSIKLNTRHLDIRGVNLINKDNVRIPVEFFEDSESEVLLVQTNEILPPPGNHLNLSIYYTGKTNQKDIKGYFKVDTGNDTGSWVTATAFQMISAREAFPCFDEPGFKSHFKVTVVHDVTHTALSNMPLSKSTLEKLKGTHEVVHDYFETTPLMPTYLLNFNLLTWEKRSIKTADGRSISVWDKPQNLPDATFTLGIAKEGLAWYENYTGLRDPMPKIDLVVIPTFPGALETWGDISFNRYSLICREPPCEGSAEIVLHELGHSWFGNLVSPKWWDSLWLSEGSATFFSNLALNELRPDLKTWHSNSEVWLSAAFDEQSGSTGEALVRRLDEIEDLDMSNLPYSQGFSVLRMLYYALGPDHFRSGIRRYLAQLQDGTTESSILYKALQYSWEGHDLEELMREYTYSPGLPVVMANRSNGILTLTQLPLSQHTPAGTSWWIPLTYTSGKEGDLGNTKPRLWFKGNRTMPDPTGPSDWLVVNNMGAGLYAVIYDEKSLQLINEGIKSGKIPAHVASRLMMDYTFFAKRTMKDTVPLSEIMELRDLASTLISRGEESPWDALLLTSPILDRRLAGTPIGEMLKGQMHKLLRNEFLRLGLHHSGMELVVTSRHPARVAKHACLYQVSECVESAADLLTRWMDEDVLEDEDLSSAQLRFTVYCSAARSGSDAAWGFLKERALQSQDPEARQLLFSALGCSTRYDFLHELLQSQIISPTMTHHDWSQLMSSLVKHNNDVAPTIDYIWEAVETLECFETEKPTLITRLVTPLAEQVMDHSQMKQVMGLLALSDGLSTKKKSDIKADMEHNILWREKNKKILFQ